MDEGGGSAGGASSRDQQLSGESEDPVRAEATAAAQAEGHTDELTDSDVQNFTESKQLEQQGPDESAVPECVEPEPVVEAPDPAEPVCEEGEMPAEEGGEAGELNATGPEEVLASQPEEAAPEPTQSVEDAPAAGPAPAYPVCEPTDWMDAVPEPMVPVPSAETQRVNEAAAQTAGQTPQVQTPNATKSQGFGSMLFQSLGDGLLGPAMPGFVSRRGSPTIDAIGKAWTSAGKGGWEGARGKIELVYQIIAGITKWTGPIGSLLGIVSYIRYIPIPPVMAVGNFLKAVSTFLSTLTYILDIVKLVLGALKIIVGILAIVFTKDPAKRAEFANTLVSDSLQFAANGFSVALSSMTNDGFKSGWKDAAGNGTSKVLGGLKNFNGGLGTTFRNVTVYKEVFNSTGRNFMMAAARKQATALSDEAATAGVSTLRHIGSKIGSDMFSLKGSSAGERIMSFAGSKVGGMVKSTVAKGMQEPTRSSSPGGAWKPFGVSEFQAQTGAADSGESLGDVVASAAVQSQTSLEACFDSSPLQSTDAPAPPVTVARAPVQQQQIALESQVLAETKAGLEEQKAAAIAGQEEATGIELAADQHIEKTTMAATELEETKGATAKDAAQQQTDKAEYDKGKAENSKGNNEMGGAGNGMPGAPGDASTDVPWYKKPFVWVIRKVNQAKAKVTDSITNAIMDAVTGAAGFDEMDGQLNEAGGHLQQQEQVLAEEPGKLDQASGVMKQETAEAEKGKADAQAQKAENAAVQAEAEARLAEVEAQSSGLEAEQQAIEADKAGFQGAYQGTFDEMKELRKKQEDEEIEAMQLPMDEAINNTLQCIVQLQTAMEDHSTTMVEGAAASSEMIMGEVESHSEEVGDEGMSHAAGEVDRVSSQLTSESKQTHSERTSALSALQTEISSYAGKTATNADLQTLGAAQGKLTSLAREFDEEKAIEMQSMHETFERAYCGLTDGLLDAA